MSQKKKKSQQNGKKKDHNLPTREEYRNATFLGWKGVLGVSLLAGALFNIPEIWKIPETNADWMMLVIVLTMALGGAILLFFRFKK